jgi:hypothetical protein
MMSVARVLVGDLYKNSIFGFVISRVFIEALVLFNVGMNEKL